MYHATRNIYQDAVCFIITHYNDLFEVNPYRELNVFQRRCAKQRAAIKEYQKTIEALVRKKGFMIANAQLLQTMHLTSCLSLYR